MRSIATDISIRPAAAADASRIAALGLLVWLHTYADEGISEPIARHVLAAFTDARIALLIEDPTRLCLLAEHDGKLLAYAVLHFGEGHRGIRCEVETLYVHTHWARKGIGRALLMHAQAMALAQLGEPAVWLTVNARNDRAIAFYQSLGFIDEGEAWFELDGTRHLNRVMVLAEAASDAL